MSDLRRVGRNLQAVALATLVIGIAACGDDGGATPTARKAASTTAPAPSPDLAQFLMRDGEEPGFRQGAAPGATPAARDTIEGVEAFVADLGLSPADARRLRDEGFISFMVQPIRGPKSAGLSNVALYETEEGAAQSLAHDLQPEVIRAGGPIKDLRFFRVPGIPGARGWTASEPHVGNVMWVQGRCLLALGNQGPGPLAGPLSTGARAIYTRTKGRCS